MSLNDTPSANRIHIGFFGCRNVGKSSVVNAVTNQEMSIVSDTKGTTTDPVGKSMELLPLGPVVIIDTPGFDDSGELGEQRIRKTRQTLNRTDVAVLVVDVTEGIGPCERQLLELFREKGIPAVVALNKCDLLPALPSADDGTVYVSALTRKGIDTLKERLAHIAPADSGRRLLADLVKPGQTVIFVILIDESAPKGRLILPEQQGIRDALDAGAASLVVQDTGLEEAIDTLRQPPAMVVTDSQAFASVAAHTPLSIPMTSFSILMARYKGFLEAAIDGVAAIERLKDGDTVLIAEGCTHHRQCNDIGTVKIPRWLRQHTGKDINIATSSGMEFPDDLSPYALVIHCGGCMISEREVRYRMKCAIDQGIPFTNYGITIAHIHGILKRALGVFPALAARIK